MVDRQLVTFLVLPRKVTKRRRPRFAAPAGFPRSAASKRGCATRPRGDAARRSNSARLPLRFLAADRGGAQGKQGARKGPLFHHYVATQMTARRHKSKLVTIVGSGYFQPIADLFDHWLLHQRPRANKVQSGFYESGYAASVVLLLVAMFESYVSRLRFVQGEKVPVNSRHAIDVVLAIYPRLRHIKALRDVYILRDALMHNHLWEVDYEWGGPAGMVLRQASRHPSSGDKKYPPRVNERTHRTKALRLSILPSRVDRTDALKVFDTIWKTLLVFENTDRFQCYVSHEYVRYRGKSKLFSELRDEVRKAL